MTLVLFVVALGGRVFASQMCGCDEHKVEHVCCHCAEHETQCAMHDYVASCDCPFHEVDNTAYYFTSSESKSSIYAGASYEILLGDECDLALYSASATQFLYGFCRYIPLDGLCSYRPLRAPPVLV